MSKSTRKSTANTEPKTAPGNKPNTAKPKAAAKKRAPANTKKERVTAETSPAATENKTSVTQNKPVAMELHHPQLHHKPKPFKEYLLESLMIFFAVMMGFVAENIRQSIEDSSHAHQLVVQLVQDLKADTARLNRICQGEQGIGATNDSLYVLLQQPVNNIDIKELVNLAAGTDSALPFHPSGGAISAIKNELHLSQFSNSKIIRYVAEYEGHIELFHTIQGITLQYQQRYLEPFMFAHFTPADLDAHFKNKPLPDASARNLTQADLTQLASEMVMIRTNNGELISWSKILKADATDLLHYVENEFHPDVN